MAPQGIESLAMLASDQTRYPRQICHDAVRLVGAIVHKQIERI